MSKLWKSILSTFDEIGARSGCHQMPERSFKIKNYTFPICARCTGVGIGQILAIILLMIGVRISFIVAIGILLIMGIDWFMQYIKILESNNIRRFITGILGGIGVINIYFYIIYYICEFMKTL